MGAGESENCLSCYCSDTDNSAVCGRCLYDLCSSQNDGVETHASIRRLLRWPESSKSFQLSGQSLLVKCRKLLLSIN